MMMSSSIFARDVAFPEGPVILPDGSLLIVEIAGEPGCVTHISVDGRTRRRIVELERPNGLAVDRDGTIWVAESRQQRLLRVTMTGNVEEVAKACDGEPFLFPNDVCFGPDGALYMTDSGIAIDDFAPGNRVRADWQTVYPDGRVYRVDPATGAVRVIDRGVRFANGVAFDPAERLYVSETLTGAVYRYAGDVGDSTMYREFFGNVIDPKAGPGMKGPDGMAFDTDGNLYVATVGQGEVTVFDPEGQVTGRLKTAGMDPTNLAFGLRGSGKLYVTEAELGRVEVFDVDAEGLALWN